MNEKISPEDEKITIQNWWDYHHQLKGDYKFWLTGSRGPEVWDYLNISRFIQPNKVVLNIGVGLGHCTKKLAERECIVHALDVSPQALARVEAFTARTWLPSSLSNMPENTFDLAISNLVTQHMADKDLLQQISGVVKSLKVEGILAMQFAFARDPAKNDLADPSEELIKCGGVCRSLEGMARLVSQAGGDIIWANRIGLFPNYGSGWYAIHIVRPDYLHVNSTVITFADGIVRKVKHLGMRVLMR
jgi:hypothetical protein